MLVADDCRDIDRLGAIHVAPGGLSDKGLVLSDSHTAVDVERLGAHPAAYELDHTIVHTGSVKRRG
jgi:hypothetical protein